MKRVKTTKKQALEEFKQYYLEGIPKWDKIAKREAWNNYTDMLCKNGYISNYQYNNWTNPY